MSSCRRRTYDRGRGESASADGSGFYVWAFFVPVFQLLADELYPARHSHAPIA